jgi:hypothetical protein
MFCVCVCVCVFNIVHFPLYCSVSLLVSHNGTVLLHRFDKLEAKVAVA